MASSNAESCQPLNTRTVQNFHLVWLTGNIKKTNANWPNCVTELHEVVNTINTFIDADECIDFITDTPERAFVILSEGVSETLLSIISDVIEVQHI